VDDDALEIGDRQGVVGEVLIVLRLTRTEHVVDVAFRVLKLEVGHRECAHIAARAGEWNPRRPMDLAALVDPNQLFCGNLVRRAFGP